VHPLVRIRVLSQYIFIYIYIYWDSIHIHTSVPLQNARSHLTAWDLLAGSRLRSSSKRGSSARKCVLQPTMQRSCARRQEGACPCPHCMRFGTGCFFLAFLMAKVSSVS